MCRHCDIRPVRRPRGLCCSCYYVPGVRELYPTTSPFANRGVNFNLVGARPLPKSPTNALPGSPEKIRVLAERAPEGQIFICAACGRRSRDRYGTQAINKGWDESCMLNAVLCYEAERIDPKDGIAKHFAVESLADLPATPFADPPFA